MECREIRINQLKQRNRELNVDRETLAVMGYVEREHYVLEEIKLNEQIIEFLER